MVWTDSNRVEVNLLICNAAKPPAPGCIRLLAPKLSLMLYVDSASHVLPDRYLDWLLYLYHIASLFYGLFPLFEVFNHFFL